MLNLLFAFVFVVKHGETYRSMLRQWKFDPSVMACTPTGCKAATPGAPK